MRPPCSTPTAMTNRNPPRLHWYCVGHQPDTQLEIFRTGMGKKRPRSIFPGTLVVTTAGIVRSRSSGPQGTLA